MIMALQKIVTHSSPTLANGIPISTTSTKPCNAYSLAIASAKLRK